MYELPPKQMIIDAILSNKISHPRSKILAKDFNLTIRGKWNLSRLNQKHSTDLINLYHALKAKAPIPSKFFRES